MKKKHNYIIILVGILTLNLSSCGKDYFDLSDNPNLVTNPSLNSLLSTVTHKTGLNTQRVSNITSYFVQYLANPSAGAQTDTYQAVADYTTTWNFLYFTMADIRDMKVKAMADGSSEHLGVANILLSYNLTLVQDLWGDAPYSDAFNPNTLTPKYDKADALYAESIKLLDEAIVELTKTDSKVKLAAGNDLIHGGDRTKWIKTAYALKARLLNKVSKKSTYSSAAVLAALSNAYSSNADDAKMGSFVLRNPWAQVAVDNAGNTLGGWLSQQLMDQLNGTTYAGLVDPRISKITDKTVNNDYKGTPNGTGNIGPASSTVKDEAYISRNSPLTADLAPLLIVTYDELKFIEAEARFRANQKPLAYTAYLDGIKANMNKLGVSATDRDAYVNHPTVSVGDAALTLNHIFKEKYIVTYLNPEAWNDARRFDYQYKDFTLPVGAALTTFIRRVPYPTAELQKNGANVPPVGSLADKLWWDQ